MTGFNQKLPSGKYQVNLHFAETYQGITAAGQRVFSFTVQGKEIKDFDPFQKSGGLRKAYVESVPVEVTDGELKITFKQQVENPAIKAIEILPQDASDKDLKPIRINAGEAEPFGNHFDQDLLSHLFSIVRAKDHPHRDVVDPRLMPQNETLQGSTISLGRLFDELTVIDIDCLGRSKRTGNFVFHVKLTAHAYG